MNAQPFCDNRIHVLVVDDSPIIRAMLKEFLQDDSCLMVVGEAANGGEALVRAHELHPDIILMDIQMPGMNGIQATKRIKRELPQTVVIGWSTVTEPTYTTLMLEAGAYALLTKGDSVETIYNVIRECLAIV